MKAVYVTSMAVLMMAGMMSGCGGSGASGRENAGLDGYTMRMADAGQATFVLSFSGTEADIYRAENVFHYRGAYSYELREDSNSAVLNIRASVSGNNYCSMNDVRINFNDADRRSGVIASGSCKEDGADIEPPLQGVERPMAGWSVEVEKSSN